MKTIRMILIALPMMLLMACGGGGGGGTAAAPNPLTQFHAAEDSPTIQAYETITNASGAEPLISDIYETGNQNSITRACGSDFCSFIVPSISPSNTITFGLTTRLNNPNLGEHPPAPNLGLVFTIALREDVTMVTEGVSFENATLARGNHMADFDGIPLEFRTFAGWLDGSVFGTTQIHVGDSSNREYRFISHSVGVPSGSNPAGTGEATWEGAAVATVKADRTFMRGDATITVPDLASPDVDITLDNWLGINGQAASGISEISYEDLTLTDGAFEGSGNDQVEGRFYGTGHTEVGGFFNTEMVTGAFGGTRQ